MPCLRVNVGERNESVGMAADAAMLCIKPKVCPTSCAMMYSNVCSTMLSGICAARAAGSNCAVCTSRQLSMVFTTSL